MSTTTYERRRSQLETYFDRTAVEAWSRLTSDAPVSRIRATVRAGRDRMRATLLEWLPADMRGLRVLDAGAGTGALSFEAARRGAKVVAIDLSPTLVGLARERAPVTFDESGGEVDFRVGDMLDARLGEFDHVVAMDSLIHYRGEDILAALECLAERTSRSLLFTFAPRTPALTVMHVVGRMLPVRSDRAPAIVPIAERRLRTMIDESPSLSAWRSGRTQRISSGFYTSQALEVAAR